MGFLVLRLQAKKGNKQVPLYVSLHCWQAWQVQLPLESQTSQSSGDLAFLVIILLICEMGACVPACADSGHRGHSARTQASLLSHPPRQLAWPKAGAHGCLSFSARAALTKHHNLEAASPR